VLLDLALMFPQQEHLPSSDSTRVLIAAVHAQQIGASGLRVAPGNVGQPVPSDEIAGAQLLSLSLPIGRRLKSRFDRHHVS
jgi:hypothetical protein